MTERNQQTLANALGIIGVILLAGSLFAITVYKRALDETLYKEAIAQSQIYTVVADIVERKVIESVIVWEKDLITKLVPDRIVDNNPIASQVLTFILDTVVEEQTPNYISGLFDKVDLENVLRSMTEKKIDSDIG